jgi:hypothetical protein
MGLRPTQGDEKRFLFSNYCSGKHRPSLCHLDRSAAEWRDLRSSGSFVERLFDRGLMGLRKRMKMYEHGCGFVSGHDFSRTANAF